jgi:6-phosphogluconate dehydrogenase (decarboxylating)
MRLIKILLLLTLLTGCEDTGQDFAMSHDPLDAGLVTNLGPVDSLGTPEPLGRWTVEEAIHHRVPTPVIAASLFARFASRQEQSPTMKAVSALRNQFGGHAVKRVPLSG